MVKRLLVNLLLEYGARAGKSVYNAYQRVINSQGAQQTGFGRAAQSTLGRFIGRPMTREEACKILNVEEAPEVDPQQVMERFEKLFEKNLPEKGGSFYIQSKVYFAKEHLMQDFPPEMNQSKFNPTEEESQEGNTEEQKQSEDDKSKK